MSIKPQVISLPAELLTQIFALLPLLPDVLNLAATCKRLQEVWTNKLNTIYTSIAPKTILCQHDARRLLADSGGPSPGSPLSSPENVRSILHNSRIVEKAIVRFEQEVVPRVQAAGFDLGKYYGSSTCHHLPHLTPGERRRFTKAYYIVLSLLHHSSETWSNILQPLTLKSLYILHEISQLNQYLPGEEVNTNLAEDRRILSYQGGEKRIQLHHFISAALARKYERVWGMRLLDPWMESHSEGALWFVVVWTHWQESLKEICCGPVRASKERKLEVNMDEVWEDSEDDGT